MCLAPRPTLLSLCLVAQTQQLLCLSPNVWRRAALLDELGRHCYSNNQDCAVQNNDDNAVPMFHASLCRSFVLTAGAALVALFVLHALIVVLSQRRMPAESFSAQLPFWLADTIGTALLLVATTAGCYWLAGRARRWKQEQAHGEHLAQMGLLTGGLIHEIRNTLNAMHCQIALLRKYLPSEAGPASQQIVPIERAICDLEELVAEFLAFARPVKDQLEEVNLAALIGELLDFIALDLEQGRVSTVTDVAPNLPPIYVDTGKLKRAFLNLFINARQAMSEGGILTVRARPSRRGEITIEVSDTGHGIPEAERPRIFQTFFSTKPDGTGLGLAIVKRTVEDLGGQISFDSEVGRGTTFRISLPTAERRRAILERKAKRIM
jgi:two-component system NtrC family sensor kinase